MTPSHVVEKINKGEMTEDEFRIIALEFDKVVSEKARGMFKTKEKYDDYIIEYYIVETMRFFFGFPPILFYAILRDHKELRETLNLKVLKTFSNYEEFRKKLQRIKVKINNIIKRNVAEKVDEIYGLDTTVATVDLNRLRQGKKIKGGIFDASFCFDSVRGVEVGYMVCTLLNLTNFSVVDVKIYPKNKAKKEIWDEMVITNLGTESGKIKVVIADAGFFAYNNILLPLNYRIIHVIKLKKNIDREELKRMVEGILTNVRWFDSRYNRILSSLLEDFEYIIKKTVEGIDRYEEFAEMRSKIELIFKELRQCSD
ncbi:hypothetical protein Asulf_01385 [Archaeoglobus sulfaticallidus PM70-1]|uniref:Transposase IS4-like domain-containing protein n=1 Tax=Archaeoglobus sulfaticallidus PM70-1 TaxID=387631 RepID=N0BLF5_9EURY|nr:transposase [Archaeoglobus sulfaticallidus]AGK61376.1 hypothetical protein Asulf_01385 [Archaeoglobus sulfaticallidus PM70-1]